MISRSSFACARNPQVKVGWSSIFIKPAGMWISGFQSRPPASIRSTRVLGSSVSRLARTQPAEPAPIMMKSACIALLLLGRPVHSGARLDSASLDQAEGRASRFAGLRELDAALGKRYLHQRRRV